MTKTKMSAFGLLSVARKTRPQVIAPWLSA